MKSREGKTSENREALFNTYIERGIENAFSLIRERFEETPKEKDRLPFHNTVHTKDMKERAKRRIKMTFEELAVDMGY